MNFCKRLRAPTQAPLRLADVDPDDTLGLTDKQAADEQRQHNVSRLAEYSELIWADNRFAPLIILQGMDTAGKDGTIRKVMSGINPRDCRVTNFRPPTPEELDHDFLWRVHKACPRRGEIGVFNRSHYEDVVTVRVQELVPRDVWSSRYEHIKHFEHELSENGTRIMKFFLHIGKDEQKKRLEARLEDPVKNWKFDPSDLEQRKRWDQYQQAYEDAIARCNPDHAPWYIIPANKKWFRNLAISSIVVETLEKLDMRPPKPKFDLSQFTVE